MTLFNWVTLIVVHALLSGTEVQGLDGPRCKFTFEMVSFRMKWLGQFFNQAFQVSPCPLCCSLRTPLGFEGSCLFASGVVAWHRYNKTSAPTENMAVTIDTNNNERYSCCGVSCPVFVYRPLACTSLPLLLGWPCGKPCLDLGGHFCVSCLRLVTTTKS